MYKEYGRRSRERADDRADELLPKQLGPLASHREPRTRPNSTTLWPTFVFLSRKSLGRKSAQSTKVTLRGVHGVNRALYLARSLKRKIALSPVLELADQFLRSSPRIPPQPRRNDDRCNTSSIRGCRKESFARDDEAPSPPLHIKESRGPQSCLSFSTTITEKLALLSKTRKAGDKVTFIGQLDIDKSEDAKPVILKEVIPRLAERIGGIVADVS